MEDPGLKQVNDSYNNLYNFLDYSMEDSSSTLKEFFMGYSSVDTWIDSKLSGVILFFNNLSSNSDDLENKALKLLDDIENNKKPKTTMVMLSKENFKNLSDDTGTLKAIDGLKVFSNVLDKDLEPGAFRWAAKNVLPKVTKIIKSTISENSSHPPDSKFVIDAYTKKLQASGILDYNKLMTEFKNQSNHMYMDLPEDFKRSKHIKSSFFKYLISTYSYLGWGRNLISFTTHDHNKSSTLYTRYDTNSLQEFKEFKVTNFQAKSLSPQELIKLLDTIVDLTKDLQKCKKEQALIKKEIAIAGTEVRELMKLAYPNFNAQLKTNTWEFLYFYTQFIKLGVLEYFKPLNAIQKQALTSAHAAYNYAELCHKNLK